MEDTKAMLKTLARKTMFNITEEEMPALINEYNVFMSHVQALEAIDTTGVDPLAFPYEIETTFLREDEPTHTLTTDEALKNAKRVKDNQIQVPKVVG